MPCFNPAVCDSEYGAVSLLDLRVSVADGFFALCIRVYGLEALKFLLRSLMRTDGMGDGDGEEMSAGGEGRKVVCVTGASGYIASWLVKLLLLRGYIVKASVRDINENT
ncbi:hypothetical protein Nepgr_009417 [Nepenthes gracilis]|uniref:Uncharacterized protein n=1 Tax=Nepenthes gracilis TaxID=150966 RepID=A0AAD3SBC5_NEPGR|nr:hypothetical protein Nepgr_009417 [Nepenthes gracilis]